MKTFLSGTRLFAILIFIVVFLDGCEKGSFPPQYNGIYGTWTVRDISGGFTGGGIIPQFDIFEIDRRMKFFLYRNDTLLYDGKIAIIDDTDEDLKIDFKTDNVQWYYLSGIKYARLLSTDSLILSDGCCDRYSYFFVRSEIYLDDKYIQVDKSLDFVDVTTYSIDFDKNFTSLFFQNENLGFITCYDGSILKTSDSGKNWKITETNNDLPLHDISFIDENTGFAVGGESSCGGTGCVPPGYLMLKTTNGGETWEKVDLPPDRHEFSTIEFADDNIGFALGLGVSLKTTDGGLTWENFNIENLMDVYDIYFLNAKTGYILCVRGKLFKTIDGGETWQDISLSTTYDLKTVMFLNEEVGYIGKQNNMLKTTDGGLTWNSVENSPVSVSKMHFSSETNGVVFGARSYASSKWDVWDSQFHVLIDGKWFGDERIYFHLTPFCLNPKQYFTIDSHKNEIYVIKINI